METIKQLERGCERPILNHPQKLVCGEFMEFCSECKARLSQTIEIVKVIEDWWREHRQEADEEERRDLGNTHSAIITNIDMDEILTKIKGEKQDGR